jgi:metal-sulfur cluster biosynthetic enzyme
MTGESPSTGVTWEIDLTHPEVAATLREALRQVIDPELGLSIVELGLVRKLALREDHVHLKMILTTPFCPYGPAMIEMTRAKAEEAAGMPATVEFGMEMWDPSMMEGGAAAAWGF